MKNIFIISCLLAICTNAFSQTYITSDNGSEVKFTIKNFGLGVTGSFKGLKGKIIFDPANASAASINVSVDAATVNTGNSSRDKHLKKEDYFDVDNHPLLTFVSSKITGKAGSYTMEGILTIKGLSKTVSFPFTATAIENGYRFQGGFKINRRDFNVGGNSWVLSDQLAVSLNVSATK